MLRIQVILINKLVPLQRTAGLQIAAASTCTCSACAGNGLSFLDRSDGGVHSFFTPAASNWSWMRHAHDHRDGTSDESWDANLLSQHLAEDAQRLVKDPVTMLMSARGIPLGVVMQLPPAALGAAPFRLGTDQLHHALHIAEAHNAGSVVGDQEDSSLPDRSGAEDAASSSTEWASAAQSHLPQGTPAENDTTMQRLLSIIKAAGSESKGSAVEGEGGVMASAAGGASGAPQLPRTTVLSTSQVLLVQVIHAVRNIHMMLSCSPGHAIALRAVPSAPS
jgi:hypothetical protein